MSDLIRASQSRRATLRNSLRALRQAQADALQWPTPIQQRHVAFCQFNVDTLMHRYCGHPKPEPLPPVDAAQCQRDYQDWLLAIPLPRIAA